MLPLRPPIMPNFIEIGQTSLEKSAKKRYLFGPSRPFFVTDVRKARLKTRNGAECHSKSTELTLFDKPFLTSCSQSVTKSYLASFMSYYHFIVHKCLWPPEIFQFWLSIEITSHTAFPFMYKHMVVDNLTHAIFPESDRFKTAKATFKVTECHCYRCHSTNRSKPCHSILQLH